MQGSTTPLVVEELSTRQAAQRKSVSIATIRNWIKSGKISARKEKNRYIVVVDDLFHFAKKYQRTAHHKLLFEIDELRDENARLRHELHKSDAHYHQMALLYDAALERAENLEEELAQYKIWEIMVRNPEGVDSYLKRNIPDYQSQFHESPQEHNNWPPPLALESEEIIPEIVYEPHCDSPKIITGELVSAKTKEEQS